MTAAIEAPAAEAGARPRNARPRPRTPCGFCSTRHHSLCPETVRNGSAAAHPTWTCPCFEQGHALGGQPPLNAEVIRMPASALAGIRDLAAAAAERRPAGRGDRKPAPAAGDLHARCERCGWDFGKPVAQSRCGSQRMCDKRVELGDPTFGRRKKK